MKDKILVASHKKILFVLGRYHQLTAIFLPKLSSYSQYLHPLSKLFI